ncbi:MAG: N-6 DNA methylase [Bacteroidetes bacterium]|nr:N-6 DNA methylase [Bacteroidota bacterium]
MLSTDLLAKIRSEQASFQQGKDFNTDLTNAKLKDEISLAWQEAKGQWTIYKSKLTRLREGETGTTETRNFWISPLLTNLGYNLSFNRTSEELNGKSFPIGYRDSSLDNFPVYVGGYHESLDKRPENKQLRVSPHAMLQEYLNYSEHLYGLVTNGRQLRLLRDASRITRLSYVEFNLEKMIEEDLYSDFVILFRVLHASRMPKKIDAGAESIMEKYHQEGLEAGSTIRNKLGEAVKGAIKNLANGFINHPNNAALREAVAAGNINTDEYYRHQLRIIYRLLFLFVIEERNLVYADSKTPATKRFNQIYFNYYSLLRLRKLARKLLAPEADRHYDLWQALVSTFSLFEKKEIGEKLGIMALQGDLFGYQAISCDQYDLHQCYLSNAVLLHIIKSLSYFENDNGVLIAVNYGGLDVEEFGSVYEGLLELKLEVKKIEGSDLYSCHFNTSNERGKSGSHYTPEELVQPLIKHSLEYLIEDRIKPYQQKKATKEATIQSLLRLKIADVACGSGHILLSAARRLSLEIARVQTDEEQPNPVAIRKAMKDVVRNCIYGVDKNPLAVELCKIALWLEAYNPGEPLNFLDHHIKCGDAIVGLAHREELEKGIADEAFKTLQGDDKAIASAFLKRNREERKKIESTGALQQLTTEDRLENTVQEAMAAYRTFNQLPETTPDEIEHKTKAYKKFIDGKGFGFLKAMADTQVAQFFIPKTDDNKDYLMTDADFRLILSGYKGWQIPQTAKAKAIAEEHRFFHWFIEFPEVYNESGFDCILGNPPYVAGRDIKQKIGIYSQNYILNSYIPNEGRSDIVAYFFRRIGDIVNNSGVFSLISTNTISQGDTRYTSLDFLIANGYEINFANKNIVWPGQAGVTITILSISRKQSKLPIILNNRSASFITSRLENNTLFSETEPFIIKANSDLIFQGTTIYGEGFKISKAEADRLLALNNKYKEVIFPFLTGDDINENIGSSPSEIVINFHDWERKKAEEYIECFEIVAEKVKPERERKGDKQTKEKWWLYMRNRVESYKKISKLDFVLVAPIVSKYLSFIKFKPDIVFSNKTVVVTFADYREGILHSSIYNLWVYKYSTTLGSSTLNFSIDDCFKKFPFPQIFSLGQVENLKEVGQHYHEHRRLIMLGMQLGLTKTYNLFHCNAITVQSINDKDKQVASLQKHLGKTANTISFDEAIKGILKLRELHAQMDEAVLDAYGWNDIALKHDFYEVDYLPENDRVRFTIHPTARKEVLKRLLELNHKIHAEEVKAGLWEKKGGRGKAGKGGNKDDYDEDAPDEELGGLFKQE